VTQRPIWDHTAGDIELAVYAALTAGDIPAVGYFLRVLAVKDPERAATVYDLLKVAIAVTEASRTNPDDQTITPEETDTDVAEFETRIAKENRCSSS
jgi:hypothetical protein